MRPMSWFLLGVLGVLLVAIIGCAPNPVPRVQPGAITVIPNVAPPAPKPIKYTTQAAPPKVARWAPTVRREWQAVFGITAPTPMALGQIQQESGGDDQVTASDLGRGLAQFMDATAQQVAKQYPELGAPDPYNATWSIRAQARLNKSNWNAVRGVNDCEHWGAALTAYNAGAGWVRKAQKLSNDPGVWFGTTEKINSGQSANNFKYSRSYPRKILFKHQVSYAHWGDTVCLRSASS